MNFPADIKYTKEHEWIRIETESSNEDQIIAQVGITDFAQSELGELVYVEVDTIGESLDQDDVFGTVEAVKTTSDLFMPVTGKVIEFNPALDETEGDNPGLINEDPYGRGWIIRIQIDDAAVLEELMDAEEYEKMVS